jgi:hypothetical protein
MTQQHRNTSQPVRRIAWFAPLLFSSLVACQEETGPVNNPPAEPGNAPGTSQQAPPPTAESNMPAPSQESSSPGEHARSVTGEVMSIDGKNYVIKDSEEKEIKVETNSMTLVDEGITVGDKAEVRYSADDKPIAIRKARGI